MQQAGRHQNSEARLWPPLQKTHAHEFFKEIEILFQCRHPNIVKLLDAFFNGVMTKEANSSIRKPSVEDSKLEQIEV